MPPIPPGDGPGSVAATPPLSDIVPRQAMAHGGTIIRPGAVAWGGMRQAGGCEGIEGALAAAAAGPAGLPGLLAELTTTRVWVPLPGGQPPFTDGAAVRLPLVGYRGSDFVPCFTSVLRLMAWADPAEAANAGDGPAAQDGAANDAEQPWQQAGGTAAVPHIVVPAAGLAARLPPGVGLALNPDSVPGLPLYPECVPVIAEFATGPSDPLLVDSWIECNAARLYTPFLY